MPENKKDEEFYLNQFRYGQCKDCFYKTQILSTLYVCDYNFYTGEMRNSLPPNCNKYKKVKKNT